MKHMNIWTQRTFCIAIVLIVVVGFALPWTGVSNSALFLTTMIMIYAIVAQGTNFLYSTAGILSVAQGALWGVGAYVAAIGLQRYNIGFGFALLLSIPAGAIVAILTGYPAKRVQGHYFAIVTFAFAEIFVIVGNNAVGWTGGNQGLIVAGRPLAGLSFLSDLQANYLVAFLCFLGSLIAAVLLQRSGFGTRLAAAKTNSALAVSLGMNVVRDRLIAFAVSGAAAGIGGVLYAYLTRYAQPGSFDVWAGITSLLIVMLGGRGYLLGPFIGSAVTLYVPAALDLNPNLNQILYGLLLVGVMLVLPQGLLGVTAQLLGASRRVTTRVAGQRSEPR